MTRDAFNGGKRTTRGALTAVDLPWTMSTSLEVTAVRVRNRLIFLRAIIATAAVAGSLTCVGGAPSPGSSALGTAPSSSAAFAIEEATIDRIHAAIRSGQTTCSAIVQAYIDRARAYNGVCTSLVTADGADIAPTTGYVRAGAPLTFPTQTTKASTIFPDLNQYRGKPLDYGRMEPTISDPNVAAQMGMRVGIPNAGQLNALETLNIRGERSVTCKGAFDAHPSSGRLPADAPAVCEAFRQQPDALERAAELDAQYSQNPDLAAMPMYCIVTAFKDPLDTKDMRTTANSDVAFAMDVPPFDATIVARLRAKGAIIYAKSVAHEFNAGPGNPGGPAESRTNLVPGGQAISAWSGQACNPYDTERVTRGSSSGSGVAISANLATIGICEQTIASCQGPASRNGIATLLATTGVMPDNGGIGNQWFVDRAGIHARTLGDAAKVLDAVRVSSTSYYDPREPFTAISKALIPEQPYASFSLDHTTLTKTPKPLVGLRIAILREHMVKSTPNHVAISDQVDREIKMVLRDRLGAELVETITPAYTDDPGVPNLAYTFADALSELLPRMMPEIFMRRDASGALLFAVPGHDVTSYDYLRKLSKRQAPLTDRINLTNIVSYGAEPCYPRAIEPWRCNDVMFDIERYLVDRRDARIRSWADWVTNARFRDDASRAGAENWLALTNHHAPGKADQVARSYIARLALQRVMSENGIAAFVHPENTVPTPKIQGPNVGQISLEGITPFLQIPRVVVPAGMTDVVYEPRYALNATKTDYVSELAPNTPRTKLTHPMPIAITFFAGQGEEPTLIKIGTAYESATHHRTPPPAFGPTPAQLGRTTPSR
jgi:Asp-tRNA(Asn)/Glu-tRNA(Gln) amidotransferase A subunit family amidase